MEMTMDDVRRDLVQRLEDLQRQIPRAINAEDQQEFRDAARRMDPIIDELQMFMKRLLRQTSP
jgi:hypothetical protein